MFTPENLTQLALLALGALFTLLTVVAVPWLKGKLSTLPPARLDLIFKLTDIAFGVVEELANKTSTPIDNKAVEGFKQLVDLLKAANARPLSPSETQLVQARFDALHAASKSLSPK